MQSQAAVLLTFFALLHGLSAERAMILGDLVYLREGPSLSHKSIAGLAMGAEVEILPHKPCTMNSATSVARAFHCWLPVRNGNMTGWMFGAFLGLRKCTTDTSQVWASTPIGHMGTHRALVRKGGKVMGTFEFDAFAMTLSPDCKYLAADSGTDFVGQIEVFDTETRKSIFHFPYSPREIKWDRDTLRFNRAVKSKKKNCFAFEEMLFKDGKLETTGKRFGKPNHGFGDLDCNGA